MAAAAAAGSPRTMKGYELSIFVHGNTSIMPAMKCGKCALVLRDAMAIECSSGEEHLFCRSCIVDHLSGSAICPIEKGVLDKATMRKERVLEKAVMQLEVFCNLTHGGQGAKCDWKGELGQRQKHREEECLYSKTPCRQECGQDILRKLMDLHVRDECKMTPRQCQFESSGCDVKLPADAMADHEKEGMQQHLAIVQQHLATMQQRLTAAEEALRRQSPYRFGNLSPGDYFQFSNNNHTVRLTGLLSGSSHSYLLYGRYYFNMFGHLVPGVPVTITVDERAGSARDIEIFVSAEGVSEKGIDFTKVERGAQLGIILDTGKINTFRRGGDCPNGMEWTTDKPTSVRFRFYNDYEMASTFSLY